ncbi:hypothetical protein BJN42_11525 [Pseudomonas koreensis]|nr:hypothetical protein BJN42_11525 [Pseudomonas koreensis]
MICRHRWQASSHIDLRRAPNLWELMGGVHPTCGSWLASDDDGTHNPSSGTNKNGSPTGLPLVVYR